MQGTLEIRDAEADDAPHICALIAQLGYPDEAGVIAARIDALKQSGGRILLAAYDNQIVGLAALDRIRHLHRPDDGRLTALVVAGECRGLGIGKRLLAAAETVFRDWGCARAELSSGERRSDAHRFYEREAYVESPKRFIKPLG
jgi:GNAT superfamily N-acetyltransferase